ARAEALAQYRQQTTPLHTFAPHVSWEEVAQALRVGFQRALAVDFQAGELTTAEWELARQLVTEKYSKLNWKVERVKLVKS
ncbi:MAG: hypothetical protein ACRDHZ_18780, partial [Ktedonobacteraceae bacterium]